MAGRRRKPTPLPIPAAALTDCGAILGKRGVGKSSLARLFLEHEIDSGHRCCFIDPMGDSAGIRLNPDMSPSRYQNVIIFGGPRGDIPISDQDGAKVATIVATHDISCIIDLSGMIQADQLRFMSGFADRLYDAIKLPITLFVDEAHIFAPQERGEAPSMLLNRMARLVSMGRKRGIFLWVMTQRPARINKNLLSQTETLVAMKMTTPRDIDAMQEWLDAHDPDIAKDVRKQLAKLNPGEAFVWVPFADFLERVQFPMHSTLDTGRTPLHGETVGNVELPKISLGKLAEAFSGMATGDPRDDELKQLREENSRLRRRESEMRAEIADLDKRERAALGLVLWIQNRIGAVIGSPKIEAVPIGEPPYDFQMIEHLDGVVRPHSRFDDPKPHIASARRRMKAAKPPEKGKKV